MRIPWPQILPLLKGNDDSLAKNILKDVSTTMPINLDENIDGNSAEEGVIMPKNDLKQWIG